MDILDQKGQPLERKKRILTIFFRWFVKNWKACIPVILSLIAIGISLCSKKISNQANQLSKQAIEISTEQFFKENKPYIILKPRKSKELQSYYKYTLLPEKNAVKIELEYNIKNIGRVAAKDLAVFDKLKVGKSTTNTKIKGFLIPQKITFGPGENYILGVAFLIGWDNRESYNKYVQKLSSEKGPEITIQMGVTYCSEFDPEQNFSSSVANKVTKERATIIKIEYEEE